ncbi:hypothetical protein CCU84_004889, partial [Escherichia coli]|nr:hypothetical protein [Escherichia coli]
PCIRSLEQKYIGESLSIGAECMSYKDFIDSKVLENYAPLNDFVEAILQNNNKDYIDKLVIPFQDLKTRFDAALQNK